MTRDEAIKKTVDQIEFKVITQSGKIARSLANYGVAIIQVKNVDIKNDKVDVVLEDDPAQWYRKVVKT